MTRPVNVDRDSIEHTSWQKNLHSNVLDPQRQINPFYLAGSNNSLNSPNHSLSFVDLFYADLTGMVQTKIPGLFLKDSSGKELLNLLKTQPSGLRGRVTLLGETEESTSGNIIVHVPGQKNAAMLVNTHHDAGWSGAVQDASGVAVVMGLAAFYSQFPSNDIQKDLDNIDRQVTIENQGKSRFVNRAVKLKLCCPGRDAHPFVETEY
jgi:hypothetical protein